MSPLTDRRRSRRRRRREPWYRWCPRRAWRSSVRLLLPASGTCRVPGLAVLPLEQTDGHDDVVVVLVAAGRETLILPGILHVAGRRIGGHLDVLAAVGICGRRSKEGHRLASIGVARAGIRGIRREEIRGRIVLDHVKDQQLPARDGDGLRFAPRISAGEEHLARRRAADRSLGVAARAGGDAAHRAGDVAGGVHADLIVVRGLPRRPGNRSTARSCRGRRAPCTPGRSSGRRSA